MDPNRSFKAGKETDESRAVMKLLAEMPGANWRCHVDLHETTDTDETEFMPARHALDGTGPYKPEGIPDGFYLVVANSNF